MLPTSISYIFGSMKNIKKQIYFKPPRRIKYYLSSRKFAQKRPLSQNYFTHWPLRHQKQPLHISPSSGHSYRAVRLLGNELLARVAATRIADLLAAMCATSTCLLPAVAVVDKNAGRIWLIKIAAGDTAYRTEETRRNRDALALNRSRPTTQEFSFQFRQPPTRRLCNFAPLKIVARARAFGSARRRVTEFLIARHFRQSTRFFL